MMRAAPRDATWRRLASLPVPVPSPTSLPVSTLLQSSLLLLLLVLPDMSTTSVFALGSAFGADTPASSAASTHHPHPAEAVQCNVAQQNCVARIGCSMALHNYMMKCGQVMHGQAEGCSPGCRKALVSLLSTEDRQGEAFMECNCNGNSYCHTQKRRLEVCSRDVLDAMKRLNDDSIQISCSLAELICRADTSCLTALSFFDRNCAKLQTGEKCTARCNNSLDILLRQRKARKLGTCICDGTETYQCQTVQSSIDRLCHYRTRHHHHNNNHSRPTRPTPHHHTTPGDPARPGHGQAVASSCSNASSDVSSQCQPITSSAMTSLRIPSARTMWYCDVRTLQLVWWLLIHFLFRCR